MRLKREELKKKAYNIYSIAIEEFWDRVNEIAYDEIDSDRDREKIYTIIWELLKNN